MKINSKIVLALSSVAIIALSGCTQHKPAPMAKAEEVKVQRAQKLVISTSIVSTIAAKVSKDDYSIKLDNYKNSQADIVLENRGDKTLTLDSIKLIDASKLFVLTKTCGAEILGGEECTLNIKFTGKKSGRYNAKVEIVSNDETRNVTKIGIAAFSKNKYQGSVEKVQSVQATPEKAVELGFNAINTVQYIKITNSGIGKLELKSPKIVGPDRRNFSYKIDCPSTLAIGQSCDLTVNYDPQAKEGYSDASIVIPSNGSITPSKNIRLVGFSKPYTVALTDFVVSKNVLNFMDNYFSSAKTYYFRTIYQKNTDRFFTNNVKAEIAKNFKLNGFTMASSADKADKIITLYPSVTVNKSVKTNDMNYNIVVNGFITTKAKDIKVTIKEDANCTKPTSQNPAFGKEKFEFGMGVKIDNATDEKDVAQTVSTMLVSKLFNVLGLEDPKASN